MATASAAAPEVIDFNIDDLTVDEAMELEERLGVPLDEMDSANHLLVVKTLGYLAGKRHSPDFTWEDAGKVRVMDVAGLVPKGAAGQPSRSQRRAKPTK